MISGADDEKNRQWYYRDTPRPDTGGSSELAEWQPFSKTDNKIINASCEAGEDRRGREGMMRINKKEREEDFKNENLQIKFKMA